MSQERFLELSQQFADIKISYDEYKIKLRSISDSEGISNFTDSIIDQCQKCVSSYESDKQRFCGRFSEDSSLAIEGDRDVDLEVNEVQPSLHIEDDVHWDDKPKAAWP